MLSVLSVSAYEAAASRLSKHVGSLSMQQLEDLYIHEKALSVVFHLPQVMQPAAWLMAVSGLRYSDIEPLRWEDISGITRLEVVQKKTNTRCSVSLKGAFPDIIMHQNMLNYPVLASSYGSFYYKLKQALARNSVYLPRNAHRATHFFRYARATYMYHCNVSIDDISKHLGHNSLDSVRNYIITDLFSHH